MTTRAQTPPPATRRDELLELAATMFAQRGLRATTVRDIADAAGILSGSLYHHFGNRERIIAALYLEGIGEYAALLEAGLIDTLDAEASVKLFVTPETMNGCVNRAKYLPPTGSRHSSATGCWVHLPKPQRAGSSR